MVKPIGKSALLRLAKLGLGLILFAFIVARLGTSESWIMITRIRVTDLLIIWLLTLTLNLVAAYRWHRILISMGMTHLSFLFIFRTTLLARFSGQALSQIVGDVGVKSLYVAERSSPAVAFKSVIWDKALEVMLMLLVLASIPLFYTVRNPSRAAALMLPLLLILLTAGISVSSAIVNRVKIRPHRRIPDLSIQSTAIHKWILSLLTLVKYIIVVFRYLWLLWIFEIDLGFMQVFLGASIAQIGNLLGITPGGLGLVEAGWTGVLHYYTVPLAKTASFLLAQRVLILLVVLLNYIGLVGWTKVRPLTEMKIHETNHTV